MKITSYKNLLVWQKSIELVLEVYKLTNRFPKEELFGLTSQMRSAAISIPSNIAEGSRRGTRKDFRHFILTSFGSGSELETHVIVANKLPFSKKLNYDKIDALLDEVMRMLNKISTTLK